MATALVGSTGLIGTTLLGQRAFDIAVHRPDIGSIDGQSFELLVCAAAPAEKGRANQDPDADWANLLALIAHLAQVQAEQVVLVSTVDVYPVPVRVDERTDIDRDAGSAYGRHRLALEDFCMSHFERVLVVRLPALFGEGLKKNFLYDLRHGTNLELTHRDSFFQFYDLRRLWADIELAREAELDLVNFATEPLTARLVAEAAFGIEFDNETEAPPVRYDVHTMHARLNGNTGNYLIERTEALSELHSFVRAWTAA